MDTNLRLAHAKCPRNPKRFLVPGDEVTVEIDGVGILTNPVVEEVFGEEETQEEQGES